MTHPPAAPPAVEIVGVTKHFGRVVAVDQVSLSVDRGQFVTLLGPSGCGKTTLLRIVAGLERPTAGDVHLQGQRVTNFPAQARGLGFAFQRYALFPHLTVLENVAFGLRVRGEDRRTRRASARAMLEMVRLADLADRKPDEISGGQAQRVALARALAPRPSVLLLDEPLAALDLAVRIAMQEELRQIHRELGTTFIYVTHDQGEALTMSDRIVLMRDGRVIQDATPHHLYRRPATLFAATFVGEANAWKGTALVQADNGGHVRVRVDELTELDARAAAEIREGQEVAYVVRPERVRLASGSENGTTRARVADILSRGARAIVVSEASGGLVVRAEISSDEAVQFAPGAVVDLRWDPREAVVFPLTGEELPNVAS